MNQDTRPVSYVNQFLKLRCAPDVLASCVEMAKPEKEISEAWSVMRRVRGITLADPMKWTLIDACAGNCLTGVLACHVLPVKAVLAIDIRPERIRRKPQRWAYLSKPIQEISTFDLPNSPTILVACHPCRKLALYVAHRYLAIDQIRHLVMVPCCCGKPDPATPGVAFVRRQMGQYAAWCYSLAHLVVGDLYFDQGCLSPCRGVVWASKDGV